MIVWCSAATELGAVGTKSVSDYRVVPILSLYDVLSVVMKHRMAMCWRRWIVWYGSDRATMHSSLAHDRPEALRRRCAYLAD